ncbi:cytochrome P450 94C1-like [Lycium ferocissimum]|uniref:cytochrome P450 94C1-like n=1 Tax=Lycium ferocissimum TaxID=112874 RepID=UPI002814EB80|nr:cytochrome P450 94C1-like [Lycium ferocissimum]
MYSYYNIEDQVDHYIYLPFFSNWFSIILLFSSSMASTTNFLILFLFIISFLFFLFLLCYFVRLKLLCKCEICQSYITSSWYPQFTNLCDWYTHLLKNSPTRTIHIHALGNTITANPENVEYMLKTRFENFPKGNNFSTILGDFLGRGIFNVDGDLWQFQRKMASLELGRISIRSYAFEVINNEIQKRLLPLLACVANKDEILDLQDVFRRFSFDSICRFSFGLDPKCLELSLPISQFAISFDLASQLSAERAMNVSPIVWKIKRFFNIGSERKLKKAIQLINILAQEVIRQRRKLGFSNHRDLLSRFMQGDIVNDTCLRDIVISFLLAGRDTVASASTSFFYLIAKNPRVAEKIREEANEVLGSNQELTSYEQLKDLHYLQASFYESMRLYPPIQFDSKFCLEDDFLPDGTFVKKGTRVTYHPYAMGRMEELWGVDFIEFKPERWINKDGVFSQENPFKYPVFQAGVRVCLGKEMALVELKSVALSFLRRFNVEIVHPSHHIPRFSPGLTASFRGGLPVFVREIKQN